MANVYDVTLSNGETRTVTVEAHHDQHTVEKFKQILAGVVQSAAGGAASGAAARAVEIVITRFVFKGKR